jgi:hypothetical protein
VQLYKDEENFVHYLVDLAVYLLEYEYDWSDSGARPWMKTDKTPEVESEPSRVIPSSNITPLPQDSLNASNKKSNVRGLTFESFTLNRRLCPYCGSIVGDLVICPSCRNVTR